MKASPLSAEFTKLITLAHDRSNAGRMQLADALAGMFWQDNLALSAQQEDLLNDIVTEIIRNSAGSVRCHLAERMAKSAKVPRRLLMTLAEDHIDVARPVLMYAAAFTDQDLIRVVGQQSVDHAAAIAQRHAISEAVADALVMTGDLKVMELVASNLGAIITPKAMVVLAEAARFTAGLRESVMKRPELTAEAATKVYWWLSSEARRSIAKRLNIQGGQTDQALEQSIEAMLLRHQLDKNNDQVMQSVTDWLLDRVPEAYPKLLVQVLRLGHYRLFNLLLARLSQLSLPIIEHVVEQTGGRSLAALCRALGADKTSFVSIFLLSRGARPDEQVVNPRELGAALNAFDRVSSPVAQQLLVTWQHDASYLLQDQE